MDAQEDRGSRSTRKKKKNDPGEEFVKQEREAAAGSWGAAQVYSTNIIGGQSKLGFDNVGGPRLQVGEARERLMQIYKFNQTPPECFVAQMAFSCLNGFLLSTCGRVFSWGANNAALGRAVDTADLEDEDNIAKHSSRKAETRKQHQAIDVGEVDFGLSVTIVKLAAGKHHVLALDSKGYVYSWGKNDKGQLGHRLDDQGVCEIPQKISTLSDIVQIYTGEYMSFAVDSPGEIWAWGLNKNNCLLTNQPEMGLVNTIVEQPMKVNLPDYFVKSNRTNVVQNTNLGFDMYQSQRPVKSKDSETQEELEQMRESNAKLRKQVKDLKAKNSALSSFGAVDLGGQAAKAGGVAAGDGADGNFQMDSSSPLEKLCQNDKVIQCIDKLIEKNNQDNKSDQESYRLQQSDLKRIKDDVEQLKKQLEDLEKEKKDALKKIQEDLQEKESSAGVAASAEAKKALKAFVKEKAQESKDIEKALDARKTQLHQ